MSVVAQLRKDLTAAMKAGDEPLKSALRMVLTEIQYAQVAVDASKVLSDDEALKVIERYHKNLVKAAEEYPEGERKDKLKHEIGIIAPYLPQKASAEATSAAIEKVVSGTNDRNFGLLMKQVMAELGGTADGKVVSALLKQRLEKN